MDGVEKEWKMKKGLQNFAKVILLLGGAGLTMGNEGCEQQQLPQARQLKKIVDLGSISAPPIYLPNGQPFDFRFVANQQLAGVLMDTETFAFRYTPVVSMSSSGAGGQLKLSQNDIVMFKSGGNGLVNWSKEATCMANLPMTRVYGSVNAFELIGGGGLTVGFNPTGAHSLAGIEAGFTFDLAQMDLSMAAVHPLTMGAMAAVNVNSNQTKVSFKFGIPLGPLFLGPQGYYQMPLAQVTKSGLRKAVDGLKTQLEKYEWHSRVLANRDTHLMVVGGKDVNLEVGDQLAVYNEEYYWDGEPCNSRFRDGVAKEPVAIVEIESVGDEISKARVLPESQRDEDAVIGAKVKIHKLKESEPAQKLAGSSPRG